MDASRLCQEHPMHPRGTAARRSGSWILWTIPAITLGWLAISHTADFHVYWGAGRALLNGGWDAVYLVSTLTPFKYHPIFAIAAVPFGLLPETWARLLWAALNAAIVFDLQRRWTTHWRLDGIAIGFGFLAVGHALFWQYQFGNVTFLMLWLWTVALTTPRRVIEALCYGVLIALKPFWLALLLPWVIFRSWRLIVRVGTVLLALTLAPLALGTAAFATAYQRWAATFADPTHAHNFPKTDNQSWYGWLARHPEVAGDQLTLLWLVGSALVGAWWLRQWRDAFRAGFPAERRWLAELSLAPFILWTAPLSWIHHQILLWPLLALAWQAGRTSRSSRAVYVVSIVSLTVLSESIVGRGLTLEILRWGVPLLAFPILIGWVGTYRQASNAVAS